MSKRLDICYYCGLPANTTEHVPPECFFPKGNKKNLITVRSCALHNNNNSIDVEYVKNFITMGAHINEHGLTVFHTKTIKAFERRPYLLKTILENNQPIILDGKPTLAFDADSNRFEKVMEAIAKGLYFHNFNKIFNGTFQIYSPSLILMEDLNKGKISVEIEDFNKLIAQIPFTTVHSHNPEIFSYYWFQFSEKYFVYLLEFYNGFHVLAIGKSK